MKEDRAFQKSPQTDLAGNKIYANLGELFDCHCMHTRKEMFSKSMQSQGKMIMRITNPMGR